MSETRERYNAEKAARMFAGGAISKSEYEWASGVMLDVTINSDHSEAISARQVLSVLAATAFELQDTIDRLAAELKAVAAAGWEATCVASNALNREAQLAARLAEAESIASAQGEIITRMSEQHAREVARWQKLCLRQAEAIRWLFKALPFQSDKDAARRYYHDLLGEAGE